MLLSASPALAVCEVFAGGGDGKIASDATEIALMRDGNRTVVTIQATYEGPPEDFLMIVPVPSALSPDDVRTVSAGIFDRLDALTGPRLVEYWEDDPCPSKSAWDEPEPQRPSAPVAASAAPRGTGTPGALPARGETQFSVGEYEALVLPADDPAALDRLLKASKLELAPGAQAALRPYAQAGAKLLLLRVDIEKVHYDNGRAVLSPIRFHYDEPALSLPIRLGAVTSPGAFDLVVYVLAPHQRYEAATYPNAAVPTNIEVSPKVKASFPSFFAALEAASVAAAPNAVVTEYAWSATTCDPCPVPALSDAELTMLGADVIPSTQGAAEPVDVSPPPAPRPPALPATPGVPAAARDAGLPPFAPTRDAVLAIPGGLPRDFVLTRLHARLARADIGDDLELRKAPPIEGGREFSGGHAPLTLTKDAPSSFQARYYVRNPWGAGGGAVECDDPRWGVWGGRDKESSPKVDVARDLASAPPDAGAPLAALVAGDVPAIGLHGTLAPPSHTWRRSTASRLKDPWVAFAIGLALGTLGLAIILARGGRA